LGLESGPGRLHTLDLLKDSKQYLIVRLFIDIMHIDVADHTILVDYEDRPFTFSFWTQDTIQLSNSTVREEITEQWIGDTAQAFCPGLQTRYTVNANAQDLSVYPIEAVFFNLIRWDLTRSYGCPSQRKECQNNIFTTEIIAEVNWTIEMTFQDKVRCGLADT
jgi:hypothetical protein